MAEARIGSRSFLGRALGGLRRRRAPRPAPAEPVTSSDGLDAAEQAALEQLGATDGYATRWPVKREVARSLASRQLV
ncbi:MAG: hypothetical protein K0S88_5737, partial [Actinomycetia bacterium]|nr:hypothetical protein [Actinomycetes bacterium]